MTIEKLLSKRAPFTPRRGEVMVFTASDCTGEAQNLVSEHDTRRFWPVPESRRGWRYALLAAVALVIVCLTVVGCYDETARAVLQCADENVRCTHVIDELCRGGDERYCDYREPWSNRGEAIEACRRAYEECYATATTTRTPDRYEWVDGGAQLDGGAR